MVIYNEMLLAQVQQTAACNALHTMESRLARWLLQTRGRIDSDVLLHIFGLMGEEFLRILRLNELLGMVERRFYMRFREVFAAPSA